MISPALLEIAKAAFSFWMNRKAADSIESVKINSEIAYIQGIRTLRFALIGLISAFLLIGVLILAVIALAYSIFSLQPWDPHTFAIYLGLTSLLILIVLGVAGCFLLSEKFWIRALNLDSKSDDENE